MFSLADLGVIGSGRFPLYWAMPWERDRETPRQAPDTQQCGLGWRYLPAVRVTVETCTCDPPRFVSPSCPRHGAQEYHGGAVMMRSEMSPPDDDDDDFRESDGVWWTIAIVVPLIVAWLWFTRLP